MSVLDRLDALRTEAERGTWTVTRSADVLALLRIARAAEAAVAERDRGWAALDEEAELRSALSDLEANT